MSPSPIDWIPGYKGYKDLELRRETDKQVRLAAAAALGKHTAALSQIQTDAIREGGVAFMDELGTLKTALQTLADRLTAAPRGYTGLFSARDIRVDTLDQITAHDREVLGGAEALGAAIESIGQAMASGSGQRAAIREAMAAVQALTGAFDKRGRFLLGG